MAEELTAPPASVTTPTPRRTILLGAGRDLDQIYTHERARADMAERNQRIIGEYVSDPLVSATHQALTSATEKVEFSKQGIEQAGQQIGKDVLPVIADPRFEAVGAGITTGGMLSGNLPTAMTGLGVVGMAKVGKGLFRSRFRLDKLEVEKYYAEALTPSSLADRVTQEINKRTPVVTDEQAWAESKKLVENGGVTLETVARFLPESADWNIRKLLAAQQVITQHNQTYFDIARDALGRGDEVMAEQALALFHQAVDPTAGYAGVVTSLGQMLRVAGTDDVRRFNLLAERASQTTEGMSALDKLRFMLADPSVDAAAQGKGVTGAYRNVMAQAKEVAATGNEGQAKLFLHEVEQAIEEEAQLSMFPSSKEVKQAQKIYKNVTAQHIVEANRAAAEKAEKDTFKLTPTGPHQPRTPQTDYLKDQAKAHLETIKEHQAQDMRLSQGTSVFSPPRETFKLTPPPGGARRPPVPKQLDLLNLIAKEPEPEQLALEMATSVERPEMSRQFLSLIKQAQKAVESGKTDEVGKVLAKIQKNLAPTPKPTDTAVSRRMVTHEKKLLARIIGKGRMENLSNLELLQGLATDPSITPEALTALAVNLRNPTMQDAGKHILINSLLTPASDAINFVSTGLNVGMHVGARAAAGVSGATARFLGGKAGVLLGEESAQFHGLYSSFWDSVKLAGRVLKTHQAELGPAALREEALRDNPLMASAMFSYSPTARRLAGIDKAFVYDSASYPLLSRAGAVSQAINFFATIAGLPGRLMLTGDQFMQAMAMNAEMHALAYRRAGQQAIANGSNEVQFYLSVNPAFKKIQQEMPDEIRKAGETFATEAVLLKEMGPLAGSVLHLRHAVDQHTGVGGTIALPFLKTLVNNAKATWEFSPLAPLSSAVGAYGRTHEGALANIAKMYRDDMFGTDPVKRDLAIGKWAFGSMVMSSMLWTAFNGRLTGRGPDTPELRKAGYAAHGLPDSFIINTDTGERIQIKRLGALANLMGMAADVAEIWPIADDQTHADIAKAMISAYVGNLDMDFMLNSVNLMEAVINIGKNESGKDWQTLLTSTTAGMVPIGGTLRAVETAIRDPQAVKDARTIIERILARFPGYDWAAKKYGLPRMPVEYNLFGKPVMRNRSHFGTEWFNPLYTSGPSGDPLLRDFAQILLDLKQEVGRPSMITGEHNLKLTNDEYDRYEQLAGRALKREVANIMDMLKNPETLDQVKRDLITDAVENSRRIAAAELRGESPDLVRDLVRDKLRRYTVPRTPKNAVRTEPPSIGP